MNKEVLELLNEQIWLENHAMYHYLNLAVEFGNKGFSGISTYFFNQSEEERQHSIKLIKYILDRDEVPTIPQYNYLEPYEETFDVQFHFENSLVQEKKVSEQVFKVINGCRKHNDHTTENFMQWYVAEQQDEESKFKDIIDKLKMVGDSGLGIYQIDSELGGSPQTEETPG
jgi:ferritin